MRWRSDQLDENSDSKDGEVIAKWDTRTSINWYRKEAGAGQNGGVCRCPDGLQYDVGDMKNDCKELACFGGEPFGCGWRKAHHPGNGMAVSCGTNLSVAEIAMDGSDNLYAVNDQSHTVMRWSKTILESTKVGFNKSHFDVVAGHYNTPGNGVKQLSSPSGLAFDNNSSLYVVDAGNLRVMRWRAENLAGSCEVAPPADPVCFGLNAGEIIFADEKPKVPKRDCSPTGWDMRLGFNKADDLFATDLCNPRLFRSVHPWRCCFCCRNRASHLV